MRERSELGVVSPGTYMKLNEFHEAIFAWQCVLWGAPSRVLVIIT